MSGRYIKGVRPGHTARSGSPSSSRRAWPLTEQDRVVGRVLKLASRKDLTAAISLEPRGLFARTGSALRSCNTPRIRFHIYRLSGLIRFGEASLEGEGFSARAVAIYHPKA